ncbi:hypothetical protein HK096_006648, partial [Nowakowskiella sp. JEL0078]
WVSFIIMTIFSVFKFRRLNYKLFYFSHQLYVVFIIASILHYYGIWYICLGPILYFIWDRFSPRLNMHRSVKVRISKIGNSVSRVDIPLVPGYFNTNGYAPGDWINIRIPSLSLYQWHPFSISSYFPESPNKITLLVSKNGDWSEKLLKISDSSESILIDATVDGIFGSRSVSYLNHEILVLVGGGTGVAALAPFLKHYIQARSNGKIYFIWVAKDILSVSAHTSLVREMCASNPNIKLYLHLTREPQIDPMIENTRILTGGTFLHSKPSTENYDFFPCDGSFNVKSRVYASILAFGVFGVGIVSYCTGRLNMLSYSSKQCLDPKAFQLTGFTHFTCWYYYYLAPSMFSVVGAIVCGIISTFSWRIFEIRSKFNRFDDEEFATLINFDHELEKSKLMTKTLQSSFCRPNWKVLFEEINEDAEKLNCDSVGVLVAGPESILQNVSKEISGKSRFKFYRESWLM